MTFMSEALNGKPQVVRDIPLPHRTFFREDGAGNHKPYYPSPTDWASEVLYFLLPDRFSDGLDQGRPVFDSTKPRGFYRPSDFRWDQWAKGGGERWQGGTLKGIISRLDYISHLGITACWVAPIFKQRRHTDEYHGYAIQNFLEVDPHFGTRQDLVDLVIAAHDRGIRIILDVIFNHSGHNWDYKGCVSDPPYNSWPNFYSGIDWLGGTGMHTSDITDPESAVWPAELQKEECYTRAGRGDLGGENVDDDHCEMKRTDFDGSFRDFNFDNGTTLTDIALCYKYWIALTDIDGMRIDTLKHVPKEAARSFCGSIKEFAANLGKTDFFLVGEVAGSDANANKYLDSLELNLNAVLDIGNSRTVLESIAKGFNPPSEYFDIMQPWDPKLGSHRNSAQRHVKIVEDHDNVSGRKTRFSTDASNDHQICAAVGIQLFTLGIPCLYYGMEQAFAGPEKSERDQYLPDFGGRPDKYLRETMFGSPHPHKHGAEGLPENPNCIDMGMPGFGAFGTENCSFFNENSTVYKRIKHLIAVRQGYPALRYGRQYLRPIRNFDNPFAPSAPGELIAWSRILDDEEMLCIVNSNGIDIRGADILVDLSLNKPTQSPGSGPSFTVVGNSEESVSGPASSVSHRIGSPLPVKCFKVSEDISIAYVEIRNIRPSEVLVLTNRP